VELGLNGRLAVITGASKGIGRAIAERLAAEGANLILVSRSGAALNAIAETLGSRHGVEVRAMAADLGLSEERARLVAAVPRIDILVNNAGAIPPGTVSQVDESAWRSAWDLKVYGTIFLTQALYPSIAAAKGVILNIIGVAAEDYPHDYIAGAAGNSSLVGFTKALAKTAADDGARVVGIHPGYTATERRERILRSRAEGMWGDAERWRELDAALPYGRAATPEEIAAAAAFLVSPLSSYTNGVVLSIDGGKR